MKIIDMHTHTFPAKIAAGTLEKLSIMSGTQYFTDGTEEALIDSQKKAAETKVAGTKVADTEESTMYSLMLPVATAPSQVSKINDGVIRMAKERAENGLLSFGAMHPDFEDPEQELARLKEHGIKGIKLHPAYTATPIDDPKHIRILKAAASLGLSVTTHAGIDIGIPQRNYCDTKMLLHILEEIPDTKLILAHMGGWIGWDDVAKDLAGTPFFYDTSFSFGPLYPRKDRSPNELASLMSEETFVTLCYRLGTDKILFGTDSPWADQKEYVDRFLALPFTEEETKAILYDNAAKLLCLENHV